MNGNIAEGRGNGPLPGVPVSHARVCPASGPDREAETR